MRNWIDNLIVTLMYVVSFYIFHCYLGLRSRMELIERPVIHTGNLPEVNFVLRNYAHKVTERRFVPVINRLIYNHLIAGNYNSDNNKIYVNLPSLYKLTKKYNSKLGRNILTILEHEAIHSAIPEKINFDFYNQKALEFRKRWKDSTFIKRVMIFLSSPRFRFSNDYMEGVELAVAKVQCHQTHSFNNTNL